MKKTLRRVRSPKAQITYDLERDGAIIRRYIPVRFGFCGWDDASIQALEVEPNAHILLDNLKLNIATLLQDLATAKEQNESAFYQLLMSSYNWDSPYSAIFLREQTPLDLAQVELLSELSESCHCIFIVSKNKNTNEDAEIARLLCEGLATTDWFGEFEFAAESLCLIQGNSNPPLDPSQLAKKLCIYHWAHYIRTIYRKYSDRFNSTEALENYLNNWLNTYVLLDDSASTEITAKYPIRRARIAVEPGDSHDCRYKLNVQLQFAFRFIEKPTATVTLFL